MAKRTRTQTEIIDDGTAAEIEKAKIEGYALTVEEEPGDFDAFFNKRIGEGEEFVINVYRIEETKSTWLKKYINVIPQKSDIAPIWGGGKFKAYGKKVGINGTFVKVMEIDKWWTAEAERLKIEEMKSLGQPGLPAAQTPSANIDDTCKLINSITPLVEALAGSKNSRAPMEEMREFITDIGKEQVRNLKEYREMIKENLQIPPTTETTTEEKGVMEKLAQEGIRLLAKWGPKFMKTEGEDRKDAVDSIKNDARFSKIMSNQELIKTIYDKGCAHKGIGVKMINEIFEACGCDLEDVPAK